MKISYISDLHLDFHAQFSKNQIKWKQRTEEFVSKLIDTDEGERDVLVIAGDLSHFNSQSIWALKQFSNHYNRIFITYGNHDMYLVSNSQASKYKHNSKNRVDELLKLSIGVMNVFPMFFGSSVEYKDVAFGGCPMWYPLETVEQKMFFNNISNDSKLIKGFNIEEGYHTNQRQYKSLLSNNVDIMISHFPVINIDSHFKYNSTACYLTPVKDIQASHWIMGHSHEQQVYEKPYCTFYMNAIGYPSESLNLSIKSFIV